MHWLLLRKRLPVQEVQWEEVPVQVLQEASHWRQLVLLPSA